MGRRAFSTRSRLRALCTRCRGRAASVSWTCARATTVHTISKQTKTPGNGADAEIISDSDENSLASSCAGTRLLRPELHSVRKQRSTTWRLESRYAVRLLQCIRGHNPSRCEVILLRGMQSYFFKVCSHTSSRYAIILLQGMQSYFFKICSHTSSRYACTHILLLTLNFCLRSSSTKSIKNTCAQIYFTAVIKIKVGLCFHVSSRNVFDILGSGDDIGIPALYMPFFSADCGKVLVLVYVERVTY